MIHHFILALIIISEGAFSCCILNSSVLFVSYQSNTASAVLETITNIQPKESGGGVGETREAIVYRLSEDMLSKLPPDYIPHEVSSPFPRHAGLTLGSTRLSIGLRPYISVASSPCSRLFYFFVLLFLTLAQASCKITICTFLFHFLSQLPLLHPLPIFGFLCLWVFLTLWIETLPVCLTQACFVPLFKFSPCFSLLLSIYFILPVLSAR